MPPVIGATTAGFTIIRQLAYDEFGELYLAEHPRLPRQQVLHLVPADISIDLDYRERFSQQSDLAAALWHPSIAGLTDRGEFEQQLWISTEYVDGVDAAELLGDAHLDGMPPRMVIEIVSAVADALDYAHDRGVLHRFVNPGKIVISNVAADRRRIALTGFGIARPDGTHNTLTRAGMFIGTAGYTAPEQLMSEELDGRADHYALAASAFHLLTGAPPFAHFNPSVVVNRQLNDRAPRPSEIRPDLVEFDAIFARALARDPVDRFRRARDFAKALESTGGNRSHIRATSEVRAASTPRETAENADAKPATEELAAAVMSNGLPGNHIDGGASIPPPAGEGVGESEEFDTEATQARARRRRHAAGIGGVIVVVVIAWFAGVKALRSASQPEDTQTTVETTSARPTTPTPAFVAPTPIVVAPLAPPPLPPAPIATTSAPTTSVSSRAAPPTTTAPAQRPAVKPPTAATTTRTSPNVLDTRPAVGMPCGSEGLVAVSNSGGPVTCISTPGGFAWAPPGAG